MEYKILNSIKNPQDVKKLETTELSLLCDEMRALIIETVSKNGGHLASNLGSIELTVAIHRAFSSPDDAIIFDVGHQCYAHKLLTGRFESFPTIRTEGGISGYMKPNESIHDPVVTGHSSTSVSAAYGIYKAKALSGENGTAVAVIGDGAMTGGMAYEALNNCGHGRSNFIVILNDNKMSISRNVGALSRCFTKLRNRPKYHDFKFAVTKLLAKIPLIGKKLYNGIFRIKELLKSVVYRNNIFADLGFNYLGPVDGHDILAVEKLLTVAKSYNRPSLVHVITTKGKGYSFAESKPKDYHGVSPFDTSLGTVSNGVKTYSDVAGDSLCEIARENNKICAVTAAMKTGTGLSNFATEFSSRFFDVGIAEQHALTFSAGLAKGGMIPFFAVYSTFLQRAYDQIIHDAAIANLPLKLLIDRAGIVGEDGETHQGIFDVAFLSSIPNINIYSPSCYYELKNQIIKTSQNNELCAIRYPRGTGPENYSFDLDDNEFTVIENNSQTAIISYGRVFCNVYEALNDKKTVDIVKLNKIFPISDTLISTLSKYKKIYFFEEGIRSGGIAEHISSKLLESKFKGDFYINAIEGEFVATATVSSSLKKYNFDVDSILRIVGE